MRLEHLAWASLSFVCGSAIASWLAYHHLVRVTSWSTRRIVAAAVGLCAGAAMVSGVGWWSRTSRYSAELPSLGITYPPALLVGPATTREAAAEDVGALAGEVDRARSAR